MEYMIYNSIKLIKLNIQLRNTVNNNIKIIVTKENI